MNVSEHVVPQLQALLHELGAVLPRLDHEVGGGDEEALHDLRVGLRRLRSLLRPLRAVYGHTFVGEIRARLKLIADASSTLRDDEVLAEILGALELSAETCVALDAWLAARAIRTQRARKLFVKKLVNGQLTRALSGVETLLLAVPKPKRDVEVRRFARKVVLAAQGDIEDVPIDGPHHVAGLHALRIAYKRLRYGIDGFESALAPELVAMRDVAARMQKRLGDLHDLDIAQATIGNARGLAEAHRASVLDALSRRRHKALRKFREEGGLRARSLAPTSSGEDAPIPEQTGALRRPT